MKISISYPPIETPKGIPLLSQNRQFQYFNSPTYIYPVIPAYAATLLAKNGYEVLWDDGIAERKTYLDWLEDTEKETPDIITIESKTPTIKHYWKVVDDLKKRLPKSTIVLMGDHVTAKPEESLLNCSADYILTGGDYDFMLLNLANHLSKKDNLDPGFYFWNKDKTEIVNTGKFHATNKLDDLPLIDRDLTKWELYAYENGNYKYLPGTYTMFGRDCWWRKDGGCTFCAWTSIYPTYRVVSVEKALDEVGMLAENYGIREIFDDTGTFPIGKWLKQFCEGMIERGYNKKVTISCNMRSECLTQEEYNLMGKANFRFILYGLESANQKTLDRLNKGVQAEGIDNTVMMAKKAGLEPHVTCMVGYPWETKEDAQRTIDLTAHLFKKGWIDTLQATIVIPYPGTALFKQCEENAWLKTKDWDEFDMRKPVMKCPMGDEEVLGLTQDIYKSFMTPSFILRKLMSVRSPNDLKFLWRGGKKLLGHLIDFKEK